MRNVVEDFWGFKQFRYFLKVQSHYDMSSEIRTFECRQCDITFVVEDTLTSHVYEIHSDDGANQSMLSYINIQSSTTINPEQSSSFKMSSTNR